MLSTAKVPAPQVLLVAHRPGRRPLGLASFLGISPTSITRPRQPSNPLRQALMAYLPYVAADLLAPRMPARRAAGSTRAAGPPAPRPASRRQAGHGSPSPSPLRRRRLPRRARGRHGVAAVADGETGRRRWPRPWSPFALLLASGIRVSIIETLVSYATYSAVLVVFVGTNSPTVAWRWWLIAMDLNYRSSAELRRHSHLPRGIICFLAFLLL